MARFSLSFLAVFLVLAAFAMSMPTKRDQSQGFGLDTALSDLQDMTKFMKGLDNKVQTDQNNEAKIPATKTESAVEQEDKADEQLQKASGNAPATPTENGLYSGNFQTPTATNTHHPTSEPNALGKIPILGGILGGTGGPL